MYLFKKFSNIIIDVDSDEVIMYFIDGIVYKIDILIGVDGIYSIVCKFIFGEDDLVFVF